MALDHRIWTPRPRDRAPARGGPDADPATIRAWLSLGPVSLQAELIDDADGWSALADEWRALAEAQGSMFLSPEWFTVWVRHFGHEATPFVVAVRDGNRRLVGLLPLSRTGRTVRFAGADLGDRFGPLAVPGLEDDVAAAAAVALGRAGRISLVLHHVDEGASWVSALTRAWPRRVVRTRLRRSVLPYLSIEGETWESFLSARSRNFRSQVGRRQRNLQRDHDARFRLGDDPTRIAADLKLFFSLHEARWSGPAGGSSLASAAVQAFHADLASAALARGWLRLWFLEADGHDVAALYCWRVGGRYAYFNAGWDRAWTDSSVGLVLLAHSVRSAIEEGAAEYDLLMGDHAYKSRFSTAERPVETLVVAGPLEPAPAMARIDLGLRRVSSRLPSGVRGPLRVAVGPLTRRLRRIRGS